ncbi:MAG: pilus assembly protein PilM, partial [Oscillospiraceae bacterium]|nr:pilus assembly protein PilM [Oscillospiraceae bacterium]
MDGLTPQTEGDIFALDIGTRNVVGMYCRLEEDVFRVKAYVSVPHSSRAMSDGQIEDISRTAETISAVRSELSKITGIDFTRAAIAAAGRALVTKRHLSERETDPDEPISDGEIHSLELEAVSCAAEELEDTEGFYCVGHSVVRYTLDDYPIKNLSGHKGSRISADVLAAFLPVSVVNGLNAAMDMCGLAAQSLTLEPIAAMNLIIPPELRLINIALADIGAGTADIAVSKDGSIFGYAMSTIAGDEITEEIERKYLVDFDTAERMKTSAEEVITYTDILGFTHEADRTSVMESVSESIGHLASSICDEIKKVNGQTPAAVFLVGGGSLLPGLDRLIAHELGLPGERVAVGGRNIQLKVEMDGQRVIDPLYITPIGIGLTASGNMGYDISSVILNGRKIRIFDTKTLTCAELIMQSGHKASEIIARTGRGLMYTLNGEKKHIRGQSGTPSQIAVNGHNVSMDHVIRPGDEILFTPAVEGRSPVVTAADITDDSVVTVNGRTYGAAAVVTVNGKEVGPEYRIQMNDDVEIHRLSSVEELVDGLVERGEIDPDEVTQVTVSGEADEADDDVSLAVNEEVTEPEPHEEPVTEAEAKADEDRDITVFVNTVPTVLPAGREHIFLELMADADIDTKSL